MDEAAGAFAGFAGAGDGSSGSKAATSVCAGARPPALDFAIDRVGTAAGVALAESLVPARRSKFSTRRTKFRIIASRCRISFCSCSMLGLVVRACALIEPGRVTPDSTINVAAVALVSSRRTRIALNRFFPQCRWSSPQRPCANYTLLEHYKIARFRP